MKTHPKARLGLAGRHALVAMIGGGESMRAAARQLCCVMVSSQSSFSIQRCSRWSGDCIPAACR